MREDSFVRFISRFQAIPDEDAPILEGFAFEEFQVDLVGHLMKEPCRWSSSSRSSPWRPHRPTSASPVLVLAGEKIVQTGSCSKCDFPHVSLPRFGHCRIWRASRSPNLACQPKVRPHPVTVGDLAGAAALPLHPVCEVRILTVCSTGIVVMQTRTGAKPSGKPETHSSSPIATSLSATTRRASRRSPPTCG